MGGYHKESQGIALIPNRPLDILRSAHQAALGELGRMEGAAKALPQDRNAAWEALGQVTGFVDRELKVHFRHEEEVLFPYLARVIGQEGPIAAMLDEHQSLWRAWDTFQEKVGELKASPADGAVKQVQAVQQIANYIVSFLRSHIQKEDTVLFPIAEEALDPLTMKEVVTRIREVETPA